MTATIEKLTKICKIIFQVTGFDTELFHSEVRTLCWFTHTNYPKTITAFYPQFEPELLKRLGSQTKSGCAWHTLPHLELIYMDVRIQISPDEYYYALIGPAVTTPFSESFITSMLNNLQLPISNREALVSFYKSIPFLHLNSQNCFWIGYYLLTTQADPAEMIIFEFSELQSDYNNPFQKNLPNDYFYTTEDIRWNYEKELIWRTAVSRGDLKTAKKALRESINNDYSYRFPADPLRTRQNILTSINALCRAASIDGGVDCILVHNTHDAISMQIEKVSNSQDIERLANHILEIYCKLVEDTRSNGYSPIIKKAVSYLHTHYEHPLTLHSVAKMIPCSDGHLSKRFHAETGKTFHIYLNDFRISQALPLLETRLYSITEVASQVGFSSYTKFSVAFKKQMGMNATEYLQQI